MSGRQKFVLYTNPNNVTNCAYAALGAFEANNVLKEAKSFPWSYRILHTAIGTDEDIAKAQRLFPHYRFV